jgi:hypothetical protein
LTAPNGTTRSTCDGDNTPIISRADIVVTGSGNDYAVTITWCDPSRPRTLMSNNSHLQTDALRNAEIALAAGLANISKSASSQLTPNPGNAANWDSSSSTPVTTPTGAGRYAMEYLGSNEYTRGGYGLITGPCNVNNGSFCLDTFRVWALCQDSKDAARILHAIHMVPTTSL